MIAPAQTERDAARDRVLIAAILLDSDPTCSQAQMEHHDAVAELLRIAGEARRLKLEPTS